MKVKIHTDNSITVVDDGTSTNETRLGAVRDIQFAIDELSLDDDMLVIAGDNLLDFSLTKFIVYAKEKGASCIMRYFEPSLQKLKKSGVAEIDESDKMHLVKHLTSALHYIHMTERNGVKATRNKRPFHYSSSFKTSIDVFSIPMRCAMRFISATKASTLPQQPSASASAANMPAGPKPTTTGRLAGSGTCLAAL